MTKKTLFSIFYLITLFSYSQTAEDFFKSGTKKLFSEDYKGAIIDFTKTIEIKPEKAKPYYYRGIAKYELKDYRGAIIDLS